MSKQNKTLKLAGYAVSLLHLLAAITVFMIVVKSEFLPMKYLYMVGGTFAVLWFITSWIVVFHKKAFRFVLGTILSAILMAGYLGGALYLNKAVSTISNITTDQTGEKAMISTYVLESDDALCLQDAKDYTFGILTSLERENTDHAVEEINKELGSTISIEEYESLTDLADALLEKKVGAIVLNKSYLELFEEVSSEDGEDLKYTEFSQQLREIKYQEITLEGQTSSAKMGDTFAVYISGIDTYGHISTRSRSDVNIIAVANVKTKQVLLVSTPRDYYVPLSISNGVKDKLTHAGIYGIDCSMDTLEQIYDNTLDYYFRVNFSGFEKIVDSLNGITVTSETAFQVGDFSYVEGENHLSGIEALAFARERYSFVNGDRQRGANQMKVIQSVIKKCQSPVILTNYSSLLNNIAGCFETNMSYAEISSLVRMQIDENKPWNVISYSVDGTGTKATTYSMSNKSVYVMVPNESSIAKAKELIQKVEDGEVLNLEMTE
ncbi:MAG: LCP family protein [bacterium]|nr:LCP family protein [bacterium]